MITKPMLAATWSGEELQFPVYATPKFDGIRALVIDNKLVSRTFKPIKNKNIVETLKSLPSGLDGELIAGNFQETTHRVMKVEETEGEWAFHVFDYVKDNLEKPYWERMEDLREWWTEHDSSIINIIPVIPEIINDQAQLTAYELQCLDRGYEGVIIRSRTGPYKCGRSTLKEGYLLKIKRFKDNEATIVGFVEYEHNTNEAEKDNFGRTKRSSKQEGKMPGGMLGNFILQLPDGQQFGCGTGFTHAQRKEYWTNKEQLLGKLVKFKHFEIGEKDLPRHPVFLGFRDQDDIEGET